MQKTVKTVFKFIEVENVQKWANGENSYDSGKK